MNKCIINEYLVTNSKLNSNNKQVAFISDIHGDINKLEMIIQKLNEFKTDALLIGGDLIDSTEDVKHNLIIKELLYELAKIMIIYFALGNHDMIYFDRKNNNHRGEVKSSNFDFIKTLANDNIHIPQVPYNKATFNTWPLDDEIDISSLNLPIDYYWNKENTKNFIALLDEVKNHNINNHKFNILLCHTPKNIFLYLSNDNFLNQFDLILTGHMHSGLVPFFLRKQTYGRGLVGPYATLLPKFAYGFLNGNNTLLTSGGVTKIPGSSELGSHGMFDMIYPSEIEVFNFQHDINNSFKKVKTKRM